MNSHYFTVHFQIQVYVSQSKFLSLQGERLSCHFAAESLRAHMLVEEPLLPILSVTLPLVSAVVSQLRDAIRISRNPYLDGHKGYTNGSFPSSYSVRLLSLSNSYLKSTSSLIHKKLPNKRKIWKPFPPSRLVIFWILFYSLWKMV